MTWVRDIVRYSFGDDEPQDCRVIAIEWTRTTVDFAGDKFPGVRFKLQPVAGGKEFWSPAFADSQAEAVSDAAD